MPRSRLLLLVIVLALALPGCISSRAYVASSYAGWENLALPPAAEPVYSVYLIGDAGAPALDPPEPTLTLLKTRLDAEDEHAAVVFLGDNVYCCGLRDSTNLSHRRQDERRLLAQIEAVRGFKGRIVFLPGNHDWNKGRVGGLQAVNRQEQFVKDALGRDDVFLPEGGFPGPVEVELTERLTLIALDTEWWLTRNEKPYGDTGEYDLEEDANFLLQLDDVIKRNSDRDLLVAGHHPLFSNGHHAGILPLRDHVFPLTRLHPALVIPLPLIGSVYPLYVRFVGSRQNMAHPRYKALRRSLRQIFSQHAGLIYASGHEHNLQYFEDQSVRDIPLYQIVSGSGSKRSPVGPGRGAGFTYGGKGFSVLHYYGDGSVWIDMWAPDGDGSTGTLLFRSRVREPDLELVDPGIPASVEVPDYRDSTVVIAANPEYQAGLVKEIFLGSHHRDTWATPVEVPVLDMGREAGGLTPIKRGGGHQTLSLRLQGADGHQYVLRSIDKDPVAAVPVNLRGTIATEIVQDQIALIQPYGAFIIPRLAEAAGIYHTNPRPVFVPSDPRLGIYQPLFAERLMLLEERPTGDMSDVSGFGGSKDVVSAARFYREITNDNDHRVDQRAYARARLFDMLLSDWDRHAGQWHWASFEPYELDPTLQGAARTDGKIYRPIPRDRDFAFNKMNGLFPSLSKYFDPRHQDFSESYGFLKGLNLSPLVQDRRLLSALERSDWIEMADSLRAALTDEVIDEAVLAWPEPVYDLNGEETSRLLKIRRDQLTDVAEAFYALHADVVDVVGSNKHERFDVTRLDDDSTRLVVYNTSEQGEGRKELYRRVFLRDETREIRLYGLGGNDRFDVAGEVLKGIRVIAVGGAGRDVFVDRSSVHGRSEHTRFYDTATGNTWEVGEETRLTLSDNDPAVNAYDPLDYKYDYHIPLTGFRLSATNGFWLGGGVTFIRHGFRKTPYAISHTVAAEYATKTRAVKIDYESRFVSFLGKWDVILDAAYLSPNTVRNFHGLGNETKNDARRIFYQARLTQLQLAPSIQRHVEPGATFRIGPRLEITRVRDDGDRLVRQPQAGVSERVFSNQWFAGLHAELILENRDASLNPMLGFRWSNAAQFNIGVVNTGDTFGKVSTDLAVYLSPRLSPQVTVALRTGAAHTVGDFPFYSATTLGRKSGLRGFRKTRFTGRTSFYQNVELRLELLSFSTFLAMGRTGVFGFFDNGRVWSEADDGMGGSRIWHQGYGGGLWLEMFNKFVLTGTAGFSHDDQTLTLKAGFQY